MDSRVFSSNITPVVSLPCIPRYKPQKIQSQNVANGIVKSINITPKFISITSIQKLVEELLSDATGNKRSLCICNFLADVEFINTACMKHFKHRRAKIISYNPEVCYRDSPHVPAILDQAHPELRRLDLTIGCLVKLTMNTEMLVKNTPGIIERFISCANGKSWPLIAFRSKTVCGTTKITRVVLHPVLKNIETDGYQLLVLKLPLRLGYADTIYQAQGITCEKIVFALRHEVTNTDVFPKNLSLKKRFTNLFAPGMLYVALSRYATQFDMKYYFFDNKNDNINDDIVIMDESSFINASRIISYLKNPPQSF